MAGIEVEIIPGPALTRPPALPPYLHQAMARSVERVRVAIDAQIRPSGRPRTKTGAGYGPLRGSFTTQVTVNATGVRGVVRTPVFYARFLEYGTNGYYYIAPITEGDRLAFGPPTSPTFLWYAHHPGIQPRRFMRSAAERERAALEAGLAEQTRAWAQAFATAS